MSDRSRTAGRRGLIVTGGASGIGLAIGLRLARAHAPVYLLSRRATAARGAVEAAFAAEGLQPPSLLDADVADRARLEDIARTLRDEGVDIGTVVASAGISIRRLALEVEDAEVRAMLDTNVYGVFTMFQVFAPLVLDGADGRFIAISSVNAVHGQRLRAAYAATKSADFGLVRALAAEWSGEGATVHAIAPGILRTPLTAGYMDANPERAAAAVAHSLVGRLGTVEDIAFTADYLASPECGYVTGQTIIRRWRRHGGQHLVVGEESRIGTR